MREDEHSSNQPEHFHAHKNDPEWELATGLIAFLASAAIVWIDREFHKLRQSECPDCKATFLSLRQKVEHQSKHEMFKSQLPQSSSLEDSSGTD